MKIYKTRCLFFMTAINDIKKSIVSAEAAKEAYALAAETEEDPIVKQRYEEMKADMDKHLMYLSNRLNFLINNNNLNMKN